MPYSLSFTPDGRGVVEIGTGVVTAAEILRSVTALNRVPERLPDLRYGYTDFTDATRVEATQEEIRTIAETSHKIAALAPRVTVAIVAPADHIYGLVRSWEIRTDGIGWETWVFRDRATALAWLRERVEGALPDEPYALPKPGPARDKP